MCILDCLPFEDLVTVAEMNAHFADIVLNHYIISKFRYHEIEITALIGILYYDDTTPKRIYISNGWKETLRVLTLFGHVFKHIRVEVSSFGTPSWQKMFEYIDKYCTQATKAINLYSVDNKALTNWTHSFDNTTTQIAIRRYVFIPIPLKDLLPFMRDLSVVELTEPLVDHYPYLRKFATESTWDDHRNPNVYELIRLNPQLRHFHTSMNTNVSYVKYLSEMLPHLELLDLDIFIDLPIINNPDQQMIHFKGVKEFLLKLTQAIPLNSYSHAIGNIKFDHLDKFELRLSTNVFVPELIKIISENKGLKEVHTNMRMTSEGLLDLVEMLPKLEQISFDMATNEMFPALQTLLLENHGLSKISVHCPYSNVSVATFSEITPSTWDLVVKGDPRFLYIYTHIGGSGGHRKDW